MTLKIIKKYYAFEDIKITYKNKGIKNVSNSKSQEKREKVLTWYNIDMTF